MYESEANSGIESSSQVPDEILRRFSDLRGFVMARTVLPWGEHCTECVWPTCYSTCDLYSPREDGKCRRFLDGMVRIEEPHSLNSYLLKIRFKRWGKLWTVGNTFMYPMAEAGSLEQRDRWIGTGIQFVPVSRLRA